jgi:hypothetical protein
MNIEPVYLAVRNIRHILKNHQIISQIVIVNDKLLNIWTIVVVIQFYSLIEFDNPCHEYSELNDSQVCHVWCVEISFSL